MVISIAVFSYLLARHSCIMGKLDTPNIIKDFLEYINIRLLLLDEGGKKDMRYVYKYETWFGYEE